MTYMNNARARFGAALLATLVLGAGLAGCDGDSNAWSGLPTGDGSDTRDGSTPEIAVTAPDSAWRVAVGDSVLVTVSASDDVGVGTVRLEGFALRGNADLGTQVRVDRFETKVVDFTALSREVRDSTFSRFLIATSDSLAEDTVYIAATVEDLTGRRFADTVAISIGGPRVQVLSPVVGAAVRAGTSLEVRLSAADSVSRIESLRVQLQGGATKDTVLRIDPPAAQVDATIVLAVPSTASGEVTLVASTVTANADTAWAMPVLLDIVPAGGDAVAPMVTFSIDVTERMEIDDTVRIHVEATDSTRVDRVGVTVRPILALPASTDTLDLWSDEVSGDEGEFSFSVGELGITEPTVGSYTLRLETAAFAVDSAGNCAAANVPDRPLSGGCSPARPSAGQAVTSTSVPLRTEVRVVRGASTVLGSGSDLLVDLVADQARQRIFVSNLSRNRVEMLGFGQTRAGSPISVGSEPWGLAIGRSGDTMFVANSGGTNISVVPIGGATVRETARIRTSNIRLYSFDFDVKTDSTQSMAEHDYSDRPQFLGQVASGQLLYSTKPTSAAADGTIRIFDATRDTTVGYNHGSEILTKYAIDGKAAGKAVVVNALEVDEGDGILAVWPRALRSADPDPDVIIGLPHAVEAELATLRAAGLSDTRIDFFVDDEDIGLSDTTFVAVSSDHSAIAFGEGATNPGRVFYFANDNGGLVNATTSTDDLVGNAAERVVGLALNGDGTLGIARGERSYFFDSSLRLQGVVASGQPSGGVALHPLNGGYPNAATHRVGFVSGVDSEDQPYVDVVDSYSFRQLRRIPIRDTITGTMTAVSVGADDLRVFGITQTGVVEIRLRTADLR